MSVTIYDESLFGDSAPERAMSPTKQTQPSTGRQIFDWAKGPGSIIVSLVIVAFSMGGKLADFRNEVAQMRIEQTAFVEAIKTRNDLLNILIQSQIDSLRLQILPYNQKQRKQEVEKIITRLEQKKQAKVEGDMIAPGGFSR